MGRVPTTSHTFTFNLTQAEADRLNEYCDAKEMGPAGILKQAFRLYDLVEQTPGALEAIRRLQNLPSKVQTE